MVAFWVAVMDMGFIVACGGLAVNMDLLGCLWDCKKESEGSIPCISLTYGVKPLNTTTFVQPK